MKQALKELIANIDKLGRISDVEGQLTRTFLSPAAMQALDVVGLAMEHAGLRVSVDPAGNILGRRDAPAQTRRTLVLGSHLDTVRDAGRFDGPLGVLLPIAAMKELRRRGIELPFNVEVVGFSEEEGVRFGCAYIGSAAYTGQLSPEMLDRSDADGVTLRAALRKFARQKVVPIQDRDEVIGYVEVHIEQGPVLESEKLAVGVVSAIAGQSRFKVSFTGKAGHAGTTPMKGRRDALVGAAEFALAVEKYAAARRPPFVATVGTMAVSPGAANVIPSLAAHMLDLRDVDDRTRKDAIADLRKIAEGIVARRGLKLGWERTQDNSAVACAPALTSVLEQSVKAVQGSNLTLVSGAGHDGVVISQVAPIAMLFVRCRDGLSHHPEEYASPADIGVALEVMIDFLQRLEGARAPGRGVPTSLRRRRTGSTRRSKSYSRDRTTAGPEAPPYLPK